jgi:hypothetical protein
MDDTTTSTTAAKVDYAVNTNLKQLFSAPTNEGLFTFGQTIEPMTMPVTPAAPVINFNTSKLFFFHFNTPSERCVLRDGCRLFQREMTADQITAQWEETKDELTHEFKRKHKSASRYLPLI